MIEDAGVLNLGFIMQSYLWEDTKYIFMTMPSEDILAQAMLDDAAEGGATKIAIGYADVPFGVNGNEYLQKLAEDNGLDIVATEEWGEQDLDFSNQVRAFEAASPDAILLWGSCAPADAQLIRATRDAGIDVPIIGNICIPSPQTVEIVGADAEGLRSFSLIDYGAPDEKTSKFIDAYTERFGSTPEPNAVPGYDAAYSWAAAAEKAGKTDSDSVAAAMLGLSYEGVAGQFNFSAENHHGLSPAAYKLTVVKDGEWVGASD
jgi:branched-chain amino acid transport system substrate-binding protein